jgi:hypothetical protein
LIELLGPEALVALEPVHRGLHRISLEPASHRASGLAAHDQPSLGQHVEVLHDRRERDRKRTRQLAHRQALLLAQPGEHGTPRWIGECTKGAVECAVTIVNHLVKYCPWSPPCQELLWARGTNRRPERHNGQLIVPSSLLNG